MGLLSKPSRGLLLEVLGKVLEEGRCTCKTAFKHCAWCDVVDVLQMEKRSPASCVEGVDLGDGRVKLRSGEIVELKR